ncbi:unnamed protein product [Effrenium voratum]|uniref:Uncharacterized protein n=1 Tax=Effrenium voratum TaxID=2562239 RepID=A0AA36JJT4_9DINO|nr:unnamed protein product [Effrenium voratum]CAJ1421252.1 unnamed protein product [Effrenium voratum]
MAAASSFQKMKARIELIHWVDVFHNMEPERAPSKIGCCLTMLMVPVILIYAVVWFAEHQRMPPTETLVIDWSVAYGPFPMKVQCIEASCWLWLSGCQSGSSGQCLALQSGEERELEMCFSHGAREGLHAWWSGGNSSGVKIWSQALSMQMNQMVEAGRSSMTYVKTQDLTQEEGSYKHLRHEWFVNFLSTEALEPQHSGCQAHRAGAQLAQIVMQPEFYDKKLEKMDFLVSLIGEVGGAYGIAFTAFFSLYVLVWNLENVYWKRAPEAQVAQVPTPVAPAGKVAEEDDVERAVL